MKRSIVPLAFLLAVACASKPQSTIYLTDVDLKPVAGSRSLRSWEKAPSALGSYRAFHFEPVVVSLAGTDDPAKQASEEEIENLKTRLRSAFATELTTGGYSVVDTRGTGVLCVRCALTELVPVDPSANAAAKVVGTLAGVGLFVPTVDIGKAAIEVEMRDCSSDERIAAFADRKAGRLYFTGLRPFRRWGDVEAAFRSWARAFRGNLDRASK